MYTDAEALNILLSTKTSVKPVTIDGVQIVRVFDDLTGQMIHESKGESSDHNAFKWLVDNRGGKARVIGDDEAKDIRLTEVENALAETNARLAAVAAASQPVTEPSDKAVKPRRGKRAAEPDPAFTSDQ